MSFLQVLTRCYQRPKLLWRNIKSLEAQSDPDWIHTLLVDGEGRGVGQAQAALANYAPYVRGAWIWVLDDDDECIDHHLVADCKAIVAGCNPDLILVRMDHGPRGVLPEEGYWRRRPVLSHIGASAFIVRQDVWKRHAPTYASATYTSDFDFINAVFDADPDVYWHDQIAS